MVGFCLGTDSGFTPILCSLYVYYQVWLFIFSVMSGISFQVPRHTEGQALSFATGTVRGCAPQPRKHASGGTRKRGPAPPRADRYAALGNVISRISFGNSLS